MNKRWAIVLILAPGCIRDAGECWVRGEEEDGVGGGVIVGGGAGGFGDVPPEPQAESGAVSGDPCVQTAECEVTWSAGSDVCKGKGTSGTCRTFYQGQHRSLDEAKAKCEHIYGVGKNPDVQACGGCVWVSEGADAEESKCRKRCAEKAEACEAECRKLPEDDKEARWKCWSACNEARAQCIRKCKK